MAKTGKSNNDMRPASAPAVVRGLNRSQAALYIGISATKLDALIKDGRMPKPRRIDGRVIWDTRELDASFDELPHDGEPERNPWDDAMLKGL